MRAVLRATQPALDPVIAERYAAGLLPLVDRPFLQHVIEYLVERGVTRFDLIVGTQAERIAEQLGDGVRWGATIRYRTPFEREPEESGDWLLCGRADCLPLLPAPVLARPALRRFVDTEGADTGWSITTAGMLGAAIAPECPVARVLSVATFERLLESQRAMLSGEVPELAATDPSTPTVARGASVHPAATLIAPVYIGPGSRIGAGAHLGPNVVVGEGCIVEAETTIQHSLLTPGSYVGTALHVDRCIVDRSRLLNLRLGAAVTIPDSFLLGEASAEPGRPRRLARAA